MMPFPSVDPQVQQAFGKIELKVARYSDGRIMIRVEVPPEPGYPTVSDLTDKVAETIAKTFHMAGFNVTLYKD